MLQLMTKSDVVSPALERHLAWPCGLLSALASLLIPPRKLFAIFCGFGVQSSRIWNPPLLITTTVQLTAHVAPVTTDWNKGFHRREESPHALPCCCAVSVKIVIY